MKAKSTKPTKTQVFNVIILDKSGSMNSLRAAAIDGFNETLAGIKKAQNRYADTQDHFVSLLTFCECEKKFVFDKVPVRQARQLTSEDYRPCCRTPLYDAMGFTLTSMRNHVAAIPDHVVVVTIITDGLENASWEYTGTAVKLLVEELKKEGWSFTYMGANQNSVEIAFTLSIRNSCDFVASDNGVHHTMSKDLSSRMNFFGRLADFKKEEQNTCCPMPKEERNACYTAMADAAFDEEAANAGMHECVNP